MDIYPRFIIQWRVFGKEPEDEWKVWEKKIYMLSNVDRYLFYLRRKYQIDCLMGILKWTCVYLEFIVDMKPKKVEKPAIFCGKSVKLDFDLLKRN